MKIHPRRFLRRSILVVAAGIMLLVLTACTGLGGGQLPPQSPAFTGAASFGFTFSCEDRGGINPQPGKLQIELSYTDHGISLIGSSFSIHGIVDVIDPVVESAVCSGPNPPTPPHTATFLGRYYLVSGAPAAFPSTCPARGTKKTPLCRFEVTVIDNDSNHVPSPGDYFSIKLSNSTSCPDPNRIFSCSELDPATVVYTRDGLLTSGNITVR